MGDWDKNMEFGSIGGPELVSSRRCEIIYVWYTLIEHGVETDSQEHEAIFLFHET